LQAGHWVTGLAVTALLSTSMAIATAADAEQAHRAGSGGKDFSLAVIGDIPYGDAQIARFPAVVDQINVDPAVELVTHLGDFKSGSSVCSTEYFQAIRAQFDRFRDPLVYTPGDNEWTDCHRPNNGSYDPFLRLAKVRALFFPRPGQTLGQHREHVRSQAREGYVENVRFDHAGVSFAAVHIVGSNNGLAPWTDMNRTEPTPDQVEEEAGRRAADLRLIHETFAAARHSGSRAVTLMIQADMFDPTVPNPAFADYSAFKPIVAAIADESRAFDGPVYLFNGDSHIFTSDHPLAAGSSWQAFYGVEPVTNLTRITVDGSTGVSDYVRVTVHRRGPDVLTWEKVPFVG
jgi:calcineurin-like phosphoesterase family protein